MKRDNRSGPALLPAPPRLGVSDLAALENRRDIAVLDTRSRDAFFAGHLAGALLTELDYQFCRSPARTWPEDTPIYLVVDDTRGTKPSARSFVSG